MSITKGPWDHMDGGIFGAWDDVAQERTLVAEVVRCCINGPHTEEGRSNANLIAAAPELYEALTGMMAAMKLNDVDAMAKYMSIGIDAIAKAEGRE